ncbi:MAG: hemerythrin domain-containing protein [Acidobacteriota bacterium]|nr:MAG: hemerythrin domain-containing protein [Acidobacteriota bacterium]
MGAIFEYMSHDHDRLDAILAEFCMEPDAGKAKELFLRFDTGLRAHIDWEEEILFPPFEERTGMRNSGPTAVMRIEHQQIKQYLQIILETIGEHDPGESVNALINLLTAHNKKEENILYPWMDQTLSEVESLALLDQIRRSHADAS